MDAIARRIEYILQNHEREERVLERQLIRAKQRLDADMEEILSRVDVKSFDYSVERVQSSPSADAALIAALAARAERTDKYSADVERIQHRLNQVRLVGVVVDELPDSQRVVLQALYYPRSTWRDAARVLGCSTSTLVRWKGEAVAALVQLCIEKYLPYFSSESIQTDTNGY